MSVNAILQGQGYTKPETDALLATKQDTLTFDNVPVFGNQNPVKSDGIYKTRAPIYGLGKNLLRNWYFVGGGSKNGPTLPVNTRGFTTSTIGGSYLIDGWKLRSSYSGAGINASNIYVYSTDDDPSNKYGSILQFINSPSYIEGNDVTLSILLSNDKLFYGTISHTDTIFPASDGANKTIIGCYIKNNNNENIGAVTLVLTPLKRAYVDIRSYLKTPQSIGVKAIKLELGTQQTLVHNEGTSNTPIWMFNEFPNFNEELAHCSLSTADSDDIFANGSWVNLGLGAQLSNQISYSNIADLPPVTGWFNINSNATGRPTGTDAGSGGVIEQIVRGSSFGYQKYYEFKNQKIFERITYDGASGWTAWTTTHTFS